MSADSPPHTPAPDPAETCLRLARLAARAAIVVGLLVLGGWLADVPLLKSVLPYTTTMKPLTALCLVLAGAALEALGRPGSRAPVAARAAGALVAAVGAATLAQYLFAADFGFDRLLFRNAVEAEGGLHPGRIAPATALGFTLLGVALVLRPGRGRTASILTQLGAVLVVLIGLLALLGYAYGEDSLYRIAAYSAIAVHTAALLCALGLGLLAVRPREGLLAVITSPHGGGLIARRILPLAILLPLFLGWLRLQGERAGWYGLEFGLALFAFSNIALFLVLVWFGARGLNEADEARAADVGRLRASEQLLADAQATAHLGSWELDLVRGQHQWSEELFRLMGRDPAVGPPPPEEFMRGVHPEDRSELQRLHAEAIEQGRAFTFAYRYALASDDTRWFEVHARPVTDAEGRVVRLTGTVLDITRRKQAEINLQESERRLRLALAAAHLGTFDWDVPGNHITWSRWHEQLWGYRPGEFDGSMAAFSCRVHPDDLPGVNAEIQRCQAQRAPFEREYRVIWPDGSTHWVQGRGEFVFGDDGQPLRMRGVVMEVTARKLVEQALAAERARALALARRLVEVQESERRQLARDLHDELGQTLTALKINLHASQPAAAPLSTGLDLIDRALQQTRALSLSLRPPLLDDLGLEAALRWLTDQQVRETGRTVTLAADPLPARPRPEIETACFRIAQEALTNALRHSQGPVALGLRPQGGRLLLTVRDEGPGFDHVAARARAIQGGSLGLLGMEERAALAGGAIEWRTAPGQGTEVSASFPLAENTGGATLPS